MKANFKIGDKAVILMTKEVVTIKSIVRAAYICYFCQYSNGEDVDGYLTDIDLRKIK